MIWPFASSGIDDLAVEKISGEHAHAMSEIHAKTFKPAWTDGDFFALLANRNVGGVFLRESRDRGGRMIGFALVRVVLDEAEVLTIAVDPKWHRRGVGRRLMDIMLANMRVDGVKTLVLEVDESNTSALTLYKRLGFQQVAIRENYYTIDNGQKSTALVMRRDVG